MMQLIGLTGGIGSGKSTAANYFKKFKIPVLDADAIVKKLMMPRTRYFKAIIKHFGPDILNKKGFIDRAKLRALVFKNPRQKKWLERFLHPAVYRQMRMDIKRQKAPYVILMVPLLIESPPPFKLDRIIFVDTPQKTRIKRIQKRSGLSRQQILSIMQQQAKRRLLLARADDLIRNTKDQKYLKKQILNLHQKYLMKSL